MARDLKCLDVFIASPSGLEDVRKAFHEVIEAYNRSDATPRGVYFNAVGWEDTLGGIGRPQSLINEDIRKCDFFVLVLWDRWGSPADSGTSKYSSGTEEEFHVALECLGEEACPMRQMVLFFKAVEPNKLVDAGPQLTKVLEFREKIEREKKHLYHSFDVVRRFDDLLRRHLAQWLLHIEKGEAAGAKMEATPLPGSETETEAGGFGREDAESVDRSPETQKAWALADEGRLTEAEVEFARAVVGRQDPTAFIEYGRFLNRVGRLDQALMLFGKAQAVAELQGNEQVLSRAFLNLGIVLATRGELDGAEATFRKSLEIEERLGRQEGMASDYCNLGLVLKTRGELDGAEAMHRKALAIDERLGRQEAMATNYNNLGIVNRAQGDLDGAEAMFRKALEINERLGRQEAMASQYGNLGIVFAARGELDGAEAMHRKSIEIDERLGRLEGLASQYGNLGIVNRARGDLDGAEAMHRKALEIDERLGGLEGMADDYGNLGNVLQTRGDLDGAEALHRKSLKINERLGRLEGIASDYGNLGNVLRTRGDLDGAEATYRKSLEIDERLGLLEGMASDYGNLGDVLESRGDLDGAEAMYRKGLEVAKRLGSAPLIEELESSLERSRPTKGKKARRKK
jgi:tetratricopeptide (TPR) repeat protein